jgi:hypothetical protein
MSDQNADLQLVDLKNTPPRVGLFSPRWHMVECVSIGTASGSSQRHAA